MYIPLCRLNATKISIHPNYTDSGKNFDVAVITLADKVKMAENIRPICLPFKGSKSHSVLRS